MTQKKPIRLRSQKSSKPSVLEVIKTLWMPISGLIGAIILGVQFLELLQLKPNLILYVVIFFLLGLTLFIFFYLISNRQNLSNQNKNIIYVMMIAVLFVAFWIKGQATRQTDYFVLDASENTGEFSQQIIAKLNIILTTDSIPNNKDIGLAVFGGGTFGGVGCDDIEELIPPAPKEKSVPAINSVVNSLGNNMSSGPGNIQDAVLFALEKLKSRPGTPRIVVITSGIDERCNKLDRRVLDIFAQENSMNFELVFLTVATSEEDQLILKEYATNQILINAESPDEISAGIEVILNAPPASNDIYYFGYYGYIPTSEK